MALSCIHTYIYLRQERHANNDVVIVDVLRQHASLSIEFVALRWFAAHILPMCINVTHMSRSAASAA